MQLTFDLVYIINDFMTNPYFPYFRTIIYFSFMLSDIYRVLSFCVRARKVDILSAAVY